MSEKENKGKEIEFAYEYDSNYRVVAANGVWGGTTPRGDFRLDFFVESIAIPERLTHEVLSDKLGKEVARTPGKGVFTRRLQVGVLLSLREVESVAGFLNEQLKIAKKLTEDK